MTPKAKETLNTILHRFKTGDIPQVIAYTLFPIPDTPSSNWSILNRTLMFFSGTQDARGFNQWKTANRYLKKGSKAVYILVPMIYKKEVDGEEKPFLGGFKAAPVFRVEDTDGEPLDYQLIELPELPYMQRAEEWGISVKAIPGNYQYYGFYSDKRKEIGLASKHETIFFHELAHAAHAKVKGKLKPGQDWQQEIVAELSAATLSQLVGMKSDNFFGNNYRYIENYAKKANLSAITACLKVMADVEQVITLVLGGDDNEAEMHKM